MEEVPTATSRPSSGPSVRGSTKAEAGGIWSTELGSSLAAAAIVVTRDGICISSNLTGFFKTLKHPLRDLIYFVSARGIFVLPPREFVSCAPESDFSNNALYYESSGTKQLFMSDFYLCLWHSQ